VSKKDEAVAALKTANPRWSDKHVAFAYELMPTSNAWAYEKGTADRDKAHKWWLSKWTVWAVEMNLLPEGTPIPDAPVALPPTQSTRVNGVPISRIPTEAKQGINAPRPGTRAKEIWDACTEQSTKLGRQVTADEIIVVATAKDWNIGNVRTEHSRWRKFNYPKQ
jgi:hypothetical protein